MTTAQLLAEALVSELIAVEDQRRPTPKEQKLIDMATAVACALRVDPWPSDQEVDDRMLLVTLARRLSGERQ